MTKVKKVPQTSGSKNHKATPYSLKSFHSKIMKDSRDKKQKRASEKKEFQDAKCSVCMEYPHNAVLLLCSSYHKGCRPYMCATSYRYSNCLDQFKKAYTKVKTIDDTNVSLGSNELLCPLCRGQVKGWTVVKRARKYLNSKKRSCMQDDCSFVGSYKNLRKHVRVDHPLARPREVDPSLAEKWKKLENDSELNDVMSTISSTMPGSIIMGDYVIERNTRGYARDYEMDNFVMRIGSRNSRRNFALRELDYQSFSDDFEIESDDDESDEISIEEHVRSYLPRVAPRRQGRTIFGGSRRWR